MSEEAEVLIQRAKAGATEAWKMLLEPYHSALYEHIRQRWPQPCVQHLSSEDILQETLLQAWLQIGSLRGTSLPAFVAWLKAVGDLRMLDALKAERRLKRGGGIRRVIKTSDEKDASWYNLLDQLPAQTKTASSVFNLRERNLALRTAIGVLPAEQKLAMQLHFLEGNTIEQTALKMSRTPAAIRGLLHRGKAKLSEDLGRASAWLSSR